jgi:hypothetical protein
MSWLLPSALAIAAIAIVGVIALHFIARSRPLAEPLPTARFVPQRAVRARARSLALSDVLLLLLRIGAVAVVGAGVAGPMFVNTHGRVRRIVLLDRSRDIADMSEARDSARSLLRAGDVLIAFDSIASRLTADALNAITTSGAPGSISAGLASALRAAVRISAETDSVELIVLSPFSEEEFDAATSRIRATWPGRIRLVALGASLLDSTRASVVSAADPNDAVMAGLSLAGVARAGGNVRLVRGRMMAVDSAWVRDSGRVLLHWPANDTIVDWPVRSAIDAVGAVTSSTGTMIGRFPRLWALNGEPVARWADGEPAAVERALGRGCIREVGVMLDAASDITLREPFRRFVARLLEPCGGARRTSPADAATLASFRGGSGTPLAMATVLRDRSSESSRWTPWLLGVGALLLLVEIVMRRSTRATG